ncbi:hypothetical protein [Arcobacter vandammei]|uniref:hypothetical protein n=1 Tax=Arcobacter vandammei TaxID=2782243 RepID=UPI0018DF734A|nr:hypothetical protein [Arcobacter vandammei]
MKKYLFLPVFMLIFLGCSTKVEENVDKSNANDVTELLKTLIKKEKEINSLKLELQDCKEKNSK